MANEYLKRTPTSTGNRKVWTFSCWLKQSAVERMVVFGSRNTSTTPYTLIRTSSPTINFEFSINAGTDGGFEGVKKDVASWYNLVVSIDTTHEDDADRIRYYVNGKKLNYSSPQASVTKNTELNVNEIRQHVFGLNPGYDQYWKGEICDAFLVDGQALTPDVFGFYKEGKGYISAGSTQATDFRPGQWVPKTPRVIKSEIERRGGFGVNGFYLPMNDSSNFGADFHCDPNSIITLKGEDLPQPKNGAPTTTDAYVSQLREDPYAANLVLALPFVSGGLGTDGTSSGINTGFGDYSAIIRGSGSANIGTHHQSSATLVNPGAASSAGGYYGSSAYFDGGDIFDTGLSINTTFADADYTIEFWMNADNQTGERGIFGVTTSSINQYSISLNMRDTVTSNSFYASFGGNSQVQVGIITHRNQWNHFAMVKSGSTGSLYLNGTAIGINTNLSAASFTTGNLKIGNYYINSGNYFYQGYIQDFRVYNTAKYKGGFDVPKPYTPVGIATWRAVPDCTANNFATWNSLGISTGASVGVATASTGNLTITHNNASYVQNSVNVGMSTGKWYAEVHCTAGGAISGIGIARGNIGGGPGSKDAYHYHYDGKRYLDGVLSNYSGNSFTTGDIIGIAFDANAGIVTCYKNGTSQGTLVDNLTVSGVGTDVYFFSSYLYSFSAPLTKVLDLNCGQNPTFSGNTTAGTYTDSNGKGLFKYQPPTGFLALCEDNLPTPAISDPGKYFKAILYQGDNTVSKEIKGVGFQPDLIWFKNRTDTVGWNIFDSVRGPAYQLSCNTTGAEVLRSGGGCWFNEDGFTVSSNANNNNANPYVAYCWRAGAGTTSTNTNGSIQSVVSVNQDAGFSIVSYTGTGSAGTIGHGLGKTPGMIICKSREAVDAWIVWHRSFPLQTNNYLQMESTAGIGTITNYWNSSAPNATTFGVAGGGYAHNLSGKKQIAYCWAEIEGFSKFGSYVGNGNADGPFVYCGFKPAWILIRSTTNARDWILWDTSRDPFNGSISGKLSPNLTDIEYVGGTAYSIPDMCSNGFKIRQSTSNFNGNGETHIFAAFAESPFTTANAK